MSERINWYKNEARALWDGMYQREGHKCVHQTGSKQKTIDLAKYEIDLFLFPDEDKCRMLLENKEINPNPTFMETFHEHKSITDYLPDLSQCVALDYGCGGLARYSINLATYFKHVHAVDVSTEAYQMAKGYIDELANKPKHSLKNITLHQNDGISLPFEDESIDFIFSNLVLQHVGTREARIAIMKEMFRVLRKGGVVRAGSWSHKLEDGHQSAFHGSGFSMDEFESIHQEMGYTVATITHKYPVIWFTLLK